ncbi:MAG: hypothetical protein AAB558_00925 [Patescibacteria group bacterium]
MPSLEHGAPKSEKKETPVVTNQEILARGMTRAEDRTAGAKETLRKEQADLRGTPQEHDLDGAVVDLRSASRNLHMEVLRTLGGLAEKKKAPQAQALVQKGRGLLEAQGRFAQAA